MRVKEGAKGSVKGKKGGARTFRKISEESCPIRVLVDKRCEGMSFTELANEFEGVSRQTIFEYYSEAKKNKFGGYEPYSVRKIKELLKNEKLTMPDIAEKMGFESYKGFLAYCCDRGIVRKKSADTVKKFVDEGQGLIRISDFYGCTFKTMQEFAEAANIKYGRKK